MTNPESQSTAYNANEYPLQSKPSSSQEHLQTLDEEQLEAVTGGGGRFSCCLGTPVVPEEPEPIVVIHPAPAPAPHPNNQEHPNNQGGHHIIANHIPGGHVENHLYGNHILGGIPIIDNHF